MFISNRFSCASAFISKTPADSSLALLPSIRIAASGYKISRCVLFSLKQLSGLLAVAALTLTGCGGSSSGPTGSGPVTPTINWPAPAPIEAGTALTSVQLDAQAVLPGTSLTVGGSYTYTPAAGTVENTAGTVTLSVTFTPYAPESYNAATGTVPLVVTAPAKQTPVITWPTPASVPAGTALSSTQLDATATAPGSTTPLAGTFTYTPPAGTVDSTAGTQTLSVTFTPTDTSDYNSATATVNLTVAQAAPTITWATPAAISVDTDLSSSQLNATATNSSGTAVPGTFTYSPAVGTELTTAGNQTLTATFTPTDTTDYSSATATVTLAVNAPSYTFTPVRIIGGGYTPGIVMHPAQQGLMFARMDIGGAYRWDNTNSIWIPLTDFVNRSDSNAAGTESIGIDPSDAQRLYLANGEYAESYGSDCDFFASDDQGATFTTLTMPFKCGSNDNGRGAGERLAVDPNLGSTILWGTRLNGLWQSTNYGVSWSQVSSFPVKGSTSGTGVVFEDFIKSSGNAGNATPTIYVGVSATGTGADPAALYVSTNGGTTWSAVPGAPTGLYVSHGVQGPDGNLYFSFGDQVGPSGLTTGAIYQYVLPTSSNPSGTWNNITPPRSAGTQGGYGAVAVDPEKPGVLMVSTLDHYYPIGDDLWRTTDYGQTWSSLDTVGLSLDDSLSPFLLFGASSTAGFGTGNWVTALAIDPFNSDHLVYGTGATIETTSNLTANDSGKPVDFTVGALGVEETAIEGLISPPSGPANLLSVMGDLDGFEHTDLDVSPANGMFQNPAGSTGTGIDFAQSVPTYIARVGNGNGSSQFGGYSTNSGAAWTPFATNPAGTVTGSGSIAVSADGTTLVWSPGDSGVATASSANNGTTWTASTGAPANHIPLSDRINARKFYIYDGSNGMLYMSTDGGQTFSAAITGVPTNGALNVSYDAEGDLWLANGSGLYHSTYNSTTQTQSAFAPITNVQNAWGVTEGAAATGSSYLTLYVGGTYNNTLGLFRSTDNGLNWIQMNNASEGFGNEQVLCGDPRVFGRVYIGTGGRGILHADSSY
jgi:hypothetical protein